MRTILFCVCTSVPNLLIATEEQDSLFSIYTILHTLRSVFVHMHARICKLVAFFYYKLTLNKIRVFAVIEYGAPISWIQLTGICLFRVDRELYNSATVAMPVQFLIKILLQMKTTKANRDQSKLKAKAYTVIYTLEYLLF